MDIRAKFINFNEVKMPKKQTKNEDVLTKAGKCLSSDCLKKAICKNKKVLLLSLAIWFPAFHMPFSLLGEYNIRANFLSNMVIMSFVGYLFALYLTIQNKEVGRCLTRNGLVAVFASLFSYAIYLTVMPTVFYIVKAYLIVLPTIFLFLSFLNHLRETTLEHFAKK